MSSRFSPEGCVQLLQNVTMTEKAIHHAGAKLVFWKRNAHDVVKLWDQEFRASDMEKRLCLFYLADNTVQSSKPAGVQYIEAFAAILPEALRHMMKHSDTRTQQKLKHVVDVWRKRMVWGNRLQGKFDSLVAGVEASEEPAGEHHAAAAGKAHGDPYATLVQRHRQVVEMSQRGQALMAAEAQARKALDDAACAAVRLRIVTWVACTALTHVCTQPLPSPCLHWLDSCIMFSMTALRRPWRAHTCTLLCA